jgi:hypothetical protein
VEETANSINHVMKRLGELEGELRNDLSKTKDLTPEYRQKKGILKRVKEERDDGHQFVDCTRREKKRARVTWES